MPTRSQQVPNERLEAIRHSLRHAFPVSECGSFTGLMDAIDPGSKNHSKEDEHFLLRSR
jgi:hypothetical protein